MQRKVFRVEQMLASRRAAPQTGDRDAVDQLKALRQLGGRHDLAGDELARELAAVQDAIARNRRELAALIGDGKNPRFALAAGELGAAVAGMEKATQKILNEAERVDEYARTLGSTLKTDYERGLAQDIQDHTVQIYEACNFQDLAGQRVAKVVETLNLVEAQLSAMLTRCNGRPTKVQVKAAAGGRLINGPKLDGDCDHASQHDIDKIFG